MKKEILKVLLDNKGAYISGEELSERLQISRTAIWKHINSLKEAGYIIEAKSRQGYRLVAKPDILLAEELVLNMETEWLGRRIQVFDEIPSTNDLAKKLAAEGTAEGTVVIADKQTQGRGRMGRAWSSPAGQGLWFSVVLRPPLQPYQASELVFVAAVGVCQALRDLTGLDILIKWPNDLLLDGKKVCGILAEMSAEIDLLNYVVIGIGINVNQREEDFPAELAMTATSLRLASEEYFRRSELLPAILLQLERAYIGYLQKGFAYILDLWKTMNCTLGREVKVISHGTEYYGKAEDLAQDGSLLVRKADQQLEKVMVGDVSLR